ncbi:MAG: hypothetical protein AAF556_13155, partial [Pseudomonadota bacterium]
MSAEEELLAFCRRLIRTQYKYVAIMIELAAFSHLRGNSRLIRLQQSLVKEMANRFRGQCFIMNNGDAVIVVRRDIIDNPQSMVDELVTSILRDPDVPEKKIRKLVEAYEIPDAYPEFRENTNRYLNGGNQAKIDITADRDEDEEPDVELDGPLSAAMLTRIEYRINRCEIRPFLKKQ